MKEMKGTKEEDKTPPAWFTSYMEKVRRCSELLRSVDAGHGLILNLHLCSLRTRWCVRRWRRSAGSSPVSAASTSPWEEEEEGLQVELGEVEEKL